MSRAFKKCEPESNPGKCVEFEFDSEQNFGIVFKTYTQTPTSYLKHSDFPKSREYPIVVKVVRGSAADLLGVKNGFRILSLNGHSLKYKDMKTIECDFDYEKRNGSSCIVAFGY